MEKNARELIQALRCTSDTSGNPHECKNCKYRFLEEVIPEIPAHADVEIDGKLYWESCDCDKIAQDAADWIEEALEDIEAGGENGKS